MIRTPFLPLLSLLFCFAPASLWAAGDSAGELSLTGQDRVSAIPLTTAEAVRLDPGLSNPHLATWVLQRKVTLENISTRKLGEGRLGIRLGTLSSDSTVYLRPPGVWYSSIQEFPCGSSKPVPGFNTADGVRNEAEEGKRLWNRLLSKEKLALSLMLGRISGTSQSSVSLKAGRVFREWLIGVDRQWRVQVESDIKPAQWKAYEKDATAAGLCRRGAKSKRFVYDTDNWLIEDDKKTVITRTGSDEPLARAPARRWNGYFAIRMDIEVGDRILNGQFVIDPTAPQSVLSPEWLVSQGVQPLEIEIPEATPRRVKLSAGEGETGLGKVAEVDAASISGYDLGLSRFLIGQVDLFDQPDSAAPCCSGVLGQDFLRRFVVEFRPAQKGRTGEVLLRHNLYRPGSGYQWVEMWIEHPNSSEPALKVNCTARARQAGGQRLCENPLTAIRNAAAPVISDLPRGRFWYSDAELKVPALKNNSGVKLAYTFVKGDRVLQVVGLGGTLAAKSLEKAGLKKGQIITELDGIPAEEMDLWEVNRRLAGFRGDIVTLKWKITPDEFKIAPIQLPNSNPNIKSGPLPSPSLSPVTACDSEGHFCLANPLIS